mmetsp:Transcript_32904/g.93533  ORF Transcript_32904/g.93533 Transcript_32904/m.93533 type:complete len:278 (+) Transcript_32904:286-1119(+)
MSASQHSVWPKLAARCSGVSSQASRLSTNAPSSNNRRTTATDPPFEAKWSGVHPQSSWQSRSTPCDTTDKSRKHSSPSPPCAARIASCNGSPIAVPEAPLFCIIFDVLPSMAALFADVAIHLLTPWSTTKTVINSSMAANTFDPHGRSSGRVANTPSASDNIGAIRTNPAPSACEAEPAPSPARPPRTSSPLHTPAARMPSSSKPERSIAGTVPPAAFILPLAFMVYSACSNTTASQVSLSTARWGVVATEPAATTTMFIKMATNMLWTNGATRTVR